MKKRFFAICSAVVMVFSSMTLPVMASEDALTRQEAMEMLLAAADDYNPSATAAEILQGYPDGQLRENQTVSETEALVMLARAFGELPSPIGDSARTAYPSDEFTDVPQWAESVLQDVFATGIVTEFSADGTVSADELQLLIQRMYALEGTNPKDDFYAAVNKDWLDNSIIQPGYFANNTLVEMEYETDQTVSELIQNISASTAEDGSSQDRIQVLYENILDWNARNEEGIAPIQACLDGIDAAEDLDQLMEVHNQILSEFMVGLLLGYGITQELEDSSQKAVVFTTLSYDLPKEYHEDEDMINALFQYVKTLLVLGGEEEETAQNHAKRYIELEASLAEAAMSAEESADINNLYHYYDSETLDALFSEIDLSALRTACGMPAQDTFIVEDPGLMETVAALATEEHVDDLKVIMKVNLLMAMSPYLNRAFTDARYEYNKTLNGVEPASDQENAVSAVKSLLPDDLGQIYIERYFSEETKENVEALIGDIIAAYIQRIQSLDWMTDGTKTKAIEKLETMNVNVGYPEQWDDVYENLDLQSTEEGGSYFENVMALNRALLDREIAQLDQPVDKTRWGMEVYTVNAYYDPMSNSINFPAAILQAPLYDPEADETENLGRIGYVIAHEISHAFDNTGAQFDWEGNQNNWWSEEDYAAFQELCEKVVAFYDGLEVAPGITCNGTLTLGENIADLGAVACIAQIEAMQEEPDYQTLYTCVANLWKGTSTRDGWQYITAIDVHAPDKLRANRVLQTLDSFYEAFDIQQGDGMYLPPEERVQIW